MKTVKCCKNCDYSLYIGAPDDPGRRRHCDVITSGRIKTEIECKEHGYKHFFPKEKEEANHGV
jgi:RNase P subunit RPR2